MELLPVLVLAAIGPLLVIGRKGGAHQTGSKSEAEAIIDGHNRVRKAVKAVAMNKLEQDLQVYCPYPTTIVGLRNYGQTWSDELAANAGVQAKSCSLGQPTQNTVNANNVHSISSVNNINNNNNNNKNNTQHPIPQRNPQHQNVGRFATIGSNVYFSPGKRPSYGAAIKAWSAEAKFYDPSTRACAVGKSCLNYTQLVWSDTESVGCSSAKCDLPGGKKPRSGYVIVCQYGPAGNRQDAAPFVKAAAPSLICSQCPKGSVCIVRENLCSPPANSTLLPDHITETEVVIERAGFEEEEEDDRNLEYYESESGVWP